MVEYRVVGDPDGLQRAAQALAGGHGPVAVDAERASGYRYSQRAYLVQMSRRGAGTFLFDPPALGDMQAVQAAVGAQEWVLHAADQDLPSLRELGLEPASLFDTELAARLLGHEHVGLGAVVEHVLGVTLAKEHSADDWSTRPLPQSWLEYAALDVDYLVDVRDALAAELAEQGKTAFAEQEFAAELARPPRPAPAEPWRRLHGLHAVRGRRGLAVARELWLARDAFARSTDVAPGRLVPDRALVAAVRAAPTSKAQLAALRDFTGRASRSQLDRWWEAIQRGRAIAEPPAEHAAGDVLPPARAWSHRHPAADRRYRAARTAVQARADELGMPTENLLKPRLLRRVAWQPPTPADADTVAGALAEMGARPWQVAQTAAPIAAAFAAAPPDTTPAAAAPADSAPGDAVPIDALRGDPAELPHAS